MIRIRIIIGLIGLISCVANAQMFNFQFNSLDKENGLSGNSIHCFLKDRNGFIWIGTNEGLNRFDGYSFQSFTHQPHDSLSLTDNIVNSLFEAPDGKLWITSGDYLDIYDPRQDRFDHSRTLFNGRIKVPPISKCYYAYDADSNVWFGNSSLGIYKYLTQKDSLIKIQSVNGLNTHSATDSIMSLAINSDGDVWVSDIKNCIEKIDRRTFKVIKRVALPPNPVNNYKLFLDSDNDVWIYDQNNNIGVLYYNDKTGVLKQINRAQTNGKFESDIVTCITEDSENRIWVGTDHGGIQIIDKHNFSISAVHHNPFRQRSLCSNSVTALYRDREGFIWIGSYKNGFSFYHPNLFNFSLFQIPVSGDLTNGINDIDNFAEDKNGNLWIGTNGGGLVYYNRQNNTFKQYKHDTRDPNSLSANIIIGLYRDSRDLLWIGTYFGGLNCYDGKRFIHYRNDPNNALSLSDDRVWDICEDDKGRIWVATLLGGVSIIDPLKQQVEKVYKGFDSPIRSFVVFDIAKGRLGELWFSTVDGLRMYNPANDQWHYYQHSDTNTNSLSHNLIHTAFEDSRGLVWIGTADGLNLLDRASGKFRVFNITNGLSSNNIYTILEDNQHRIWLGTSNGLSVIDYTADNGKDTFKITNFDDKDGLQSKVFNEKSAFKTSKGELVFGGNQGFNLFNPAEVALKNLNAKTVITDFQIFNQSIKPSTTIDGDKFLEQTLPYTKAIALKYKYNLFSIEFSNLNYFFSERRQYQYILEGFQTKWLTVGSNTRRVTYTNLNPGTYTFKVKATNTNGQWENEATTLVIKVLPPWWNTIYFKISIILLVIGLIALSYYIRFYRIQNQKKKLEQLVKERTTQLRQLNSVLIERQKEITRQNTELETHRNELEKMVENRTAQLETALVKAESADKLKSAFLANMSHEIRTPMNAIFGFAALLRDSEITTEENNRFIDIIQSSCDTLLVIINDILDISKIEANQLEINLRKTNLHNLLLDVYNYYSLQNQEEVKIVCDNDCLQQGPEITTDPVRLNQIIVNLLNNAVKFTSQGEIHYGYAINAQELEFYVSDTGIGIDDKYFESIFKQFNKLEPDNIKFYKGAGLGLAIAKKLTELLGGRIWLKSKLGVGTTFYFTIPNH